MRSICNRGGWSRLVETLWFAPRSRSRTKRTRCNSRGVWVERLEQRTLLTVELVSVTPAPPPLFAGALTSTNPAISAGGRYVAFQSRATDLVAGFTDTNGGEDVFVRDLMLDTTVLISRVATRAGDGKSFDPDISDSGRFVTFASFATDLAPGTVDDNGVPDVFVHDRDADVDGVFDEPGATSTTLLSVSPGGTSGTGASGAGPLGAESSLRPRISGDGRFVTFGTLATDLAIIDPTPADAPLMDFNGGVSDVIKARVADGALDLVSINFSLTGTGGGSASNPSISFDGSRVAFQSGATTLVPPSFFDASPPFPPPQVYVGAGSSAVELVSVTPDGLEIGDDVSREPVISRNGRHVAFISKATDLDPRATNTNGLVEDIFVRDLVKKTTTLVSRSRAVPGPITTGDGASPGVPGFGAKFIGGPAVSDTGRFIPFRSDATNLLDPALGVADTNGFPDIFVFDRDSDLDGIFDEPGATTTMLVSVNSAGTDSPDAGGAFGHSFAPSISGDGRLVAFNSTFEDLVPGVSGSNVYVRDLVTGTTTLISGTISGGAGGPLTGSSGGRTNAISSAGNRVAFISATLATDLDPSVVADANLGTDVFAGTPPPDIRGATSKASFFTRAILVYSVVFEPVAPFEIGVYRSADAVFGATDELLGTLPISDPDDLTVGGHEMFYTIGSGPGEIALPGIIGGLADETDDDYFILLVADHLDAVAEFDDEPFAEDNTGFFDNVYHELGGPVFYHGRKLLRTGKDANTIIATATATDVTVTFSGANSGTVTYALADVTGLRIRTHTGDDTVTSGPLPDLIHGGEGKDLLDGGAGDDTIDGGPGPDTITGGPGDDILFDGPGDDIVDAGVGDDTVISTPGSDDVFTDTGGSDTLNFSMASQAITLDLDSTATQRVDAAGNTVRLVGQWESFIGTPNPDFVYGSPLTIARIINGGAGPGDRLIFDAKGLAATFDGTRFNVPGFAPVTVIGFEDIQTINAAPRIIDNSDPGYSEVGNWIASDPNFPQGFNGGVRFNAAGTGSDVATWHFQNVPPGRYMVSATGTFAGDRAKNSPFTIRNGGPTGPIADTVLVNQEQNPGEFDPPEDGQNILFRNLTLVDVTGDALTVLLSDNADQFVAADAVRIEVIGDLSKVRPLIVDDSMDFDGDALTVLLPNNASGRGAFGGHSRVTSVNGVGTWHLGTVDTGGSYMVAATWPADPTNPTDAVYEVQVGANMFTFNANQQQAPNSFVEGNIPFQILGEVDVGAGDLVDVRKKGLGAADAVGLFPVPDFGARLLELRNAGIVNVTASGAVVETGLAILRDVEVFFILEVANLTFNTGLAHLQIDSIEVTGAGFRLHSPPRSTILPPGGSDTFEVAFTANSLGTFNGAVSIAHNGVNNNPFIYNLTVNVVEDTTPPTVNIVEPPDGIPVIEGTTISVSVEAMDDIAVERVKFLVDGQVVATDTTVPFQSEILVPTGVTQVTVKARAFDLGGNSGDSPPIVLDVMPDQPPTVQIITPPDASDVVEGQVIQVEVEATDDVGIERVEFLMNGQLVETVTDEPFVAQFVVPQLAPGQNIIRLQARAFDAAGNRGEATVNLTVQAATAPPSITDVVTAYISAINSAASQYIAHLQEAVNRLNAQIGLITQGILDSISELNQHASAGSASGVQNQITELITWNSRVNEAIIEYIFAVQNLANAYSTAVTLLVQDFLNGISHPSQGVSAINEQESQNTAALTQTNHSAIAAADSLTDKISQTALAFDNDGSGSVFASGFRADRLTGNADKNSFEDGGNGDGTLDGDTENEMMLGEDGLDSMLGGLGNDALSGEAGTEVLKGNEGNDTVLGGTGADSLLGGSGVDLLIGENDNDTLSGQASSGPLSGGAGSNTLVDVANGTSSTDDDDTVGVFMFDMSSVLGALP